MPSFMAKTMSWVNARLEVLGLPAGAGGPLLLEEGHPVDPRTAAVLRTLLDMVSIIT